MRFTSPTRQPGRLLAIGLVAALAVAACSGDDDAADDATGESTESVESDESTESSESADDEAPDADDEALAEALQRAEAAELEAAEAEVVAEQLESDLAVANAQVAEADAALADATGTLELLAESETVRADTAEDEVQRFSDLFPIVVESTLTGIELEQEGVWNLDWEEAYCDFDFCPLAPSTAQATFVRTPDNFLRVVVPGVLDAGLFAVDGSLYAIVDSDTTTLPACPNGTPRDTRVTMTVYADDIQVNEDGTREVTGLEGAITLDARTVGDCTGGVAFYGVKLNRPG